MSAGDSTVEALQKAAQYEMGCSKDGNMQKSKVVVQTPLSTGASVNSSHDSLPSSLQGLDMRPGFSKGRSRDDITLIRQPSYDKRFGTSALQRDSSQTPASSSFSGRRQEAMTRGSSRSDVGRVVGASSGSQVRTRHKRAFSSEQGYSQEATARSQLMLLIILEGKEQERFSAFLRRRCVLENFVFLRALNVWRNKHRTQARATGRWTKLSPELVEEANEVRTSMYYTRSQYMS